MQKRQLKIDTNFLEEEDSSPKIGSLSANRDEDRN
jgi:hypothetical protein